MQTPQETPRERQYRLDSITYQYAEQWHAWHRGKGERPNIEQYIARHPEFALELFDFALWWHTIGFDLPSGEDL